MNLPNSISLTRIASVPVLLFILRHPWFNGNNGERELIAVTVFILASLTDGLDGWLARRNQQITTMGMLLDPLADKLMIAGAFIALVQFNPRIVPAWMAVIIVGREFLVSGLRSIAASQGFTIEASDLGKFKMVVQIIAVVAALLDHRWRSVPLPGFIFPLELIAKGAMWFMVALSSISAIDYFQAFWSKIDSRVQRKSRRRAFVLSRRRAAQPSAEPQPRPERS